MTEPPLESAAGSPGQAPREAQRELLPRAIAATLIVFEGVLYTAVGLLLVVAAALILGGTVSQIVSEISDNTSAVQISVTILDRILLTLIVAELAYTLRFVLRTHDIMAEPFLFIGLIAVVRRILIVTAELERLSLSGRSLTNVLLELGLLGVLAFALAASIFLVRRSGRASAAERPIGSEP